MPRRANVYASGATGGTTDAPPLRVLVLGDVYTQNSLCASTRDPRVPFFPAIQLYGATLFVADDFNDAIDAFASDRNGTVNASRRVSGSATQLNAPIALVISSHSAQ